MSQEQSNQPKPQLQASGQPGQIIEEIVEDDDERGGCRGCLYAIAGGMGCLFVPVVLVIVLAIAAGSGLNSLGDWFEETANGLVGVFRPPAEPTFNTAAFVYERVQNLSQLTTTTYNFSNIVTSELEMPGVLNTLYGEKLVMVAVGHVQAGIDLSTLQEQDIVLSNGILIVNLPAPSLQDCFLDENASYVISRETGVFAAPSPNLDSQSRRYAREQFRNKALENGILIDAKEQAEMAMRELLTMSVVFSEDIDSVVINVADSVPNTPYPTNCR